ncbi:MAG: DUF4190 domain-containing protein [Lachnospiraceae bacterium]|nr:DUF4190 domain-containing protein [Ruminococcus sp.]MCM1275288.1 DUF4190 domain-containing protein [Lachnospiraceae bacterium]
MTVKNMAIVSLICGLIGFGGSFIPFAEYAAPFCSIAGIVFGALALSRINKTGDTEHKDLALIGLICGIVSSVKSILSAACAICAVCTATGAGVCVGIMEMFE